MYIVCLRTFVDVLYVVFHVTPAEPLAVVAFYQAAAVSTIFFTHA
jgi:hypothetical protein